MATFEDPVFGQERAHVQHAIGAIAPGMRALLENAYFRGASEDELAERLTLAKEVVVPSLARVYHELRHSLHEGRR
jgi:DNA-directed RNA polymerase specialized sigma24 family protein